MRRLTCEQKGGMTDDAHAYEMIKRSGAKTTQLTCVHVAYLPKGESIMAKDASADLMKALMQKLYKTITGNGDGEIKMPRNKFVSWLMPGVPMDPSDFLFCSKGFIGNTAEETQQLYHQGFVLSKLLDFVPEISADPQFLSHDMQQTLWTTTQDSLSSVYNDVLKYSRVLNNELSDKEKEKLAKFRNLLTVTKEKEDIITGEKTQVSEPGPLTLAYTAKMNDYIDAADEYMNLLIDAQSAKGDSPEAIRRVAAFANKSKFIRKKMEAAEMAWVSQGYKNEYEQINAYIDQVTQKSMVLYKQDLLRKFNQSRLTSPVDGGSDFYYTTLLPGNFATSLGWTKFTYYSGDYETHYDERTSKWGASGGVHFGLFSIGAKAGGSKKDVKEDSKSSNFSATLEFTQVPICRPGFDPGFFWMRAWDLDNTWYLNFNNKEVSNGAEQPVGRLIAYSVNALFVRNVRFTFNEAEEHKQYAEKHLSAGGFVGYGPFVAGGSYESGSIRKDVAGSFGGGMVDIPGIQLIGFINNVIPKAPNLHPDIKPEQLVGGA